MNDHDAMSFKNPSSFVTYRLAKLQSQLNAQGTAILKEKSGLSLVEWRVIQVIRMFDKPSPSQIAEHVQMDKGQLSRKIKGMIKKGLLKSQRDVDDKRIQKLELTEIARDINKQLVPIMEQRQHHLLADVTPEELELFYLIIKKIEAASKIRDIK
ncbi:MAG: MarR family winged helix-turn-helix transcriptional regulator [Candidatus Puniceispirillaceae bacterium]